MTLDIYYIAVIISLKDQSLDYIFNMLRDMIDKICFITDRFILKNIRFLIL